MYLTPSESSPQKLLLAPVARLGRTPVPQVRVFLSKADSLEGYRVLFLVRMGLRVSRCFWAARLMVTVGLEMDGEWGWTVDVARVQWRQRGQL